MRRTKRSSVRATFLCVALLLATPVAGAAPAGSAEPSKRHVRLAEELLVAVGARESVEASIPQLVQAQIDQAPDLRVYRDVLLDFYRDVLSWDELEKDLVPLYTRAFTEQELVRLLEFYRSPVGRKALKTMPELFTAGARVVAQRVQGHLPELQKRIEAERERLKRMSE
jgi:hypothetical protein